MVTFFSGVQFDYSQIALFSFFSLFFYVYFIVKSKGRALSRGFSNKGILKSTFIALVALLIIYSISVYAFNYLPSPYVKLSTGKFGVILANSLLVSLLAASIGFVVTKLFRMLKVFQ